MFFIVILLVSVLVGSWSLSLWRQGMWYAELSAYAIKYEQYEALYEGMLVCAGSLYRSDVVLRQLIAQGRPVERKIEVPVRIAQDRVWARVHYTREREAIGIRIELFVSEKLIKQGYIHTLCDILESRY